VREDERTTTTPQYKGSNTGEVTLCWPAVVLTIHDLGRP